MQTVDTFHGELPVIDTWKQCRHTKTGWTGVNAAGERLNIRSHPDEEQFGPARMPPDKEYVILARKPGPGEFGNVSGLVPVGVALIERALRVVRAKRKPPSKGEG
jgi:hypothetical protein